MNPIVMVGMALYYFPFFLLAVWVFELVLAVFLLRRTRRFWIGWAEVIVGSMLFLPSLIFFWTWVGELWYIIWLAFCLLLIIAGGFLGVLRHSQQHT